MSFRPEILAPAGDLASLDAALQAGADAIYLGLDEGFNARARAKNFDLENLPATVDKIHRAGAKVYVTLNTLVFEPELPFVEELLRAVAESGADAIIVQDPAVCLLAREICPALEIHASTQMTISSPDAALFAKDLGATRFVVPRESSIDEIRALREKTSLELEVFIHGALCVSWSGQCLTSEAWGGRSANRGQCAQSCRLPYDLVLDGVTKPLGDVAYLLSPQDLAGVRALPSLVEMGVSGLKIEGRQKGPQYVATAVRGYRAFTESIASGAPMNAEAVEHQLADMAVSYTRGQSDGFFGGSDHQMLVEGRFPKHRGLLLGRVTKIAGDRVHVARAAREWTGGRLATETSGGPSGDRRVSLPMFGDPRNVFREPTPGMGVVFDAGHPEDKNEAGGPIFTVDRNGTGWVLGFGRTDLSRVHEGDLVWLTQDPEVQRGVQKLLSAEPPSGRWPIRLEIAGTLGEPLHVVARLRPGKASEVTREATSRSVLAASKGAGIDEVLLQEKLGSFGGTPFRLDTLDASNLPKGLHLPVSELKEIRRALVVAFESALTPRRSVDSAPKTPSLRSALVVSALAGADAAARPRVIPLCRTTEQLEAAIEAGLSEVELDWMEMVGLSKAAARAKASGLKVHLATLRIEKPGEETLTDRLLGLSPDAIVVRHWGGFERLRGKTTSPPLLGDFSLNVTNSLTARYLLARGLMTFTPSFDLDETQLYSLLGEVPCSRASIVVHHRIPTFHTEHCVYAHLLSEGRDYRSCGRPCEAHEVSLRDRVGKIHPVIVDAGCRNTVFNEAPQSAALQVPKLVAMGVTRFRIDFVRESKEEARQLIDAYGALLLGRKTPADVLKLVAAEGRVGVSPSMSLFRREAEGPLEHEEWG